MTATPERPRHSLGKHDEVAGPAHRRQLCHERAQLRRPLALRNWRPTPRTVIEISELDVAPRQGQRAKAGGDDALGISLEPVFARSGGERDLALSAQPRRSKGMMRNLCIEPRNCRHGLGQRSKSGLPLFAPFNKTVERSAHIQHHRLRDSYFDVIKSIALSITTKSTKT